MKGPLFTVMPHRTKAEERNNMEAKCPGNTILLYVRGTYIYIMAAA